MVYREPGVRAQAKRNSRNASGVAPNLYPAIIGSGVASLTKVVSVVRAFTGMEDTIPVDGNVTAIQRIGNFRTSTDYVAPADYSLSDPITNPNKIIWAAGPGTPKSPVPGSTYFVSLTYAFNEQHYMPRLVTSLDDVVERYGPDVSAAGVVNPISLGAQLCLESGARAIYVMQIKPAGAQINVNDYSEALMEKLSVLPDVYRVVPMDLRADINLQVINHVTLMSSPEERSERVALIGVDHAATDLTSLISTVGGYAEALSNARVSVIYPDRASRTLSDGKVHILGPQYLCAALAGWRAAQPVSRAFTKGQIMSFDDLLGLPLVRTEKNMVAARGVMVLEQDKPGQPVEVRHGLTTDMSSVQARESSITEIADFSCKLMRAGLKSYIGKENISDELIVKVRNAASSILSTLVRMGAINGGSVLALYQDEMAKDTLVMKVQILVPYPCNYIDIVLYLD